MTSDPQDCLRMRLLSRRLHISAVTKGTLACDRGHNSAPQLRERSDSNQELVSHGHVDASIESTRVPGWLVFGITSPVTIFIGGSMPTELKNELAAVHRESDWADVDSRCA